jgi:hypothetical protein
VTSLSFQGGDCDVSAMVASHAGDVTPTSRGVPALLRTDIEERVCRLVELAWSKTTSRLEGDGLRFVLIPSKGVYVELTDLTAIELAELLVPESFYSSERDTRPADILETVVPEVVRVGREQE